MVTSIKASLGRQRLTANVSQTERNYTQKARDTMKAIIAKLKMVEPLMLKVTDEVMQEAFEPVFEKSKYYCPKDTEKLVRSGRLDIGLYRGKRVANISYGVGGNPHYTVYVHEMVDVPHAEPTRAKFLSSAIEEDIDGIKDRLETGYSKAFQ